MEQQPQTESEFEEAEQIVEQRSLYGDMRRSHEFSDKTLWTDEMLRAMGDYWKNEEKKAERSPRALKEIDKLLGRSAFEMVMRQNEIINKSMQELEDNSFKLELPATEPSLSSERQAA